MRSARRVSIGTPAVGIMLFALCLQAVGEAPVQIQIRVLNAKNGNVSQIKKYLSESRA